MIKPGESTERIDLSTREELCESLKELEIALLSTDNSIDMIMQKGLSGGCLNTLEIELLMLHAIKLLKLLGAVTQASIARTSPFYSKYAAQKEEFHQAIDLAIKESSAKMSKSDITKKGRG